MAQVDSENSTAAPGGRSFTPDTARLAKEAAKRQRALKRLRRLRAKAADEIDRLLAFLDAVDDTDVDSQCDDDPCDDLELEPSLSGVTVAAKNMPVDQFGDDRELEEGNDEPDVDDEPSLGSSNDHHGNGTSYINWTDIIDAEGHDDDLEPSLGWTEQFGKGDDGQWGGSADYEDCRWLPQLDRSQVSI